uniref:Cilia- and flagella-associated protein 52 n=1 Tax=Knipowitschia caucasica TaxID=637954 RepID=A0AAV2LMM8_KNICA
MSTVTMSASSDQDIHSRGRQRSHSYYCSEDSRDYGLQSQREETRPRSRSFYSYETSELFSSSDIGIVNRPSPLRQRASSLLFVVNKTNKQKEDCTAQSQHKKQRLKQSKAAKDSTTSMMTISEADNWKICCNSGMKYGQFVDWEKIDPEAAKKYQMIVQSDHQQLKALGRQGYWEMPHTLRAKSYYHIIHSINSSIKTVHPGRNVYYELTKKLFGEQKVSSHPAPEYMEDAEIPRYCLNKAGLNSVKKILICLGKYFPDMNYCPILPALVSLILHFSMDEAECFYSVARLICYTDPNKRYIDQTFLTYRASCMTFGDLANKCCRGIRKLIASSHQNLFEFYSDWIMWIFADLPFIYAIRVLDVYLLEGFKVLYRVALALLGLYKVSVSSRVADVEDFRTDMKRFVQNVARHCTPEDLLNKSFQIPMATRRELNLLFNANKDSLMQKGVSSHQKRQSVESVDFTNFSSSVVTGTEMQVVWAWIPERFALFSPIRLYSTTEHQRSLASFYSHVEGHEPAVLLIKTVDEEVFGAFLSTDVIERRKHENLTYFGTGECFVFTLRPSMERYQQALINIMTRLVLGQQNEPYPSGSALSISSSASTINGASLTCPVGTPQDPSFLTVPFTAQSTTSPSAKQPKRAKEQEASMFIAGNESQLVIGGDGGHALCVQQNLHEGYSECCETFKNRRSPVCTFILNVMGPETTSMLTKSVPGEVSDPIKTEVKSEDDDYELSGQYIASGQVNFMGFKADVIIWDYEQRNIYAQLSLHMAKVEALSFSPNNKYLVSLGGVDDGSIVVWDIETKQAICGSPASPHSAGPCLTVKYSNHNDHLFVSAGSGTLRVWELDIPNRKIRPLDCQMGKFKRIVKCIEITDDDRYVLCGTTSGDIMRVNMKSSFLSDCGPVKTKYSLGVTALSLLNSGHILVGSGSGTFTLCSSTNFKIVKRVELEKGVTSIALGGEGQQFFVGTDSAQIYRFSCENFKAELISTSHNSAVKDVAISSGSSELFATCSLEDIRLWHINRPKELLRITVPNMTCNSIDFMIDGHSIISAWNDGKIRVFAPASGTLMITIDNAHKLGVTAIAGTRDCRRIVSGGGEGQVRIWELLSSSHRMLGSMKEHKDTVTCIQIRSDDKECVSAGSDGACIIWDLERFVSLQTVIANTFFQAVSYHPEEYQILTSGTDRKITYWNVYDGSPIREMEGSHSGAINGVHITQDGKYFVTGGDEKLVKIWDYVKGIVTHTGKAHGGSITSVKVCNNSRILISTSADGAILCWKFPHVASA